MSLQVWLPLNSDILNQGISDAIFTGTPTYGDGKLGKCLTNGTITSTNTTIPVTITTNPKYSICAWVKTTSTSVWVWRIGDGTGTSRGLWIGTGNAGPHFAYSGSGAFTGSVAINNGVWHHVCFTVDGATASAYVDGVYCGGSTSVKTDPVSGNAIYLFATSTCALQDFRIYDHCLSPREVKEISKGIVCHYKLDGPVPNLLLATGTPKSYSSGGLNTSNFATNDMYNMQAPVNQLFAENDIVTFSFHWQFTPGSSGTISGNFHTETGNVTPWTVGNVVSAIGTRSATSNYIDLSETNTSGYASVTYKVSAAAASAADTFRYFRIRRDNTPSDGTFTFSNCKLERGSIATPWVPNSADTEYTAMGYNDTTEPDVSGYGYNATKYNITYSADTARYSSCPIFNGTNGYMKMDPTLYQLFRIPREEVTVSIWAYRDNWKDYATSGSSTQWDTMFSCQEAGGFTIYETTLGSFTFVIGTGSSSNTYKTAGVGNAYAGNLSAGWHHFALTYNGLDLKGYIDGNLVKTTNCYTTKTQIWYYTGATTVFIGAEASSGTGAPVGGYYWRGRLSDFRVYDTALSDTDIKELYNTPVSIANNGAMLVAGEIVEV